MRLYTGSWIATGRRGRYKRQSGQRYSDIWWLMHSAFSLLRFNSTYQGTSWSPLIGLCLLRRAACNLLWLQWHRISYPILPLAVTSTGRGGEGSAPVLGWQCGRGNCVHSGDLREDMAGPKLFPVRQSVWGICGARILPARRTRWTNSVEVSLMVKPACSLGRIMLDLKRREISMDPGTDHCRRKG